MGSLLFLGVSVSFLENDDPGEVGDVMFLWEGCLAVVVCALVLLPARRQLEQMKAPIATADDAKCMRRLKFVLVMFCVNMGIVAVYYILAFVGGNPIQKLLHKRVKEEKELEVGTRAAYAIAGIVLQDLPAAMAVMAVFWLRRRVLEFAIDPLFSTDPHDRECFLHNGSTWFFSVNRGTLKNPFRRFS
jgi:hypothetical protein